MTYSDALTYLYSFIDSHDLFDKCLNRCNLNQLRNSYRNYKQFLGLVAYQGNRSLTIENVFSTWKGGGHAYPQ